MLSLPLYMNLLTRFLKGCGIKFNGIPNYISPDVYFDNFHKITIGNDCVISKHVVFLTHDYSITTAIKAEGHSVSRDISLDGDIIIGDNVFIGLRSTILPGVKIGANSIVGACSVVKGTIPSGVVVAGSPAKPIMTTKEYLEKKRSLLDICNG